MADRRMSEKHKVVRLVLAQGNMGLCDKGCIISVKVKVVNN